MLFGLSYFFDSRWWRFWHGQVKETPATLVAIWCPGDDSEVPSVQIFKGEGFTLEVRINANI